MFVKFLKEYEECINDLYKELPLPIYNKIVATGIKGKGFAENVPDFTVLNIRKRKELYLEHFGMMDNPAYAEKAINKIQMYEQNGIYVGEKLMLTYETSKNPINPKPNVTNKTGIICG